MQMVAITTALPSRVCATMSPNPTVVSVVTTCRDGAGRGGREEGVVADEQSWVAQVKQPSSAL